MHRKAKSEFIVNSRNSMRVGNYIANKIEDLMVVLADSKWLFLMTIPMGEYKSHDKKVPIESILSFGMFQK